LALGVNGDRSLFNGHKLSDPLSMLMQIYRKNIHVAAPSALDAVAKRKRFLRIAALHAPFAPFSAKSRPFDASNVKI